MTDKDRAAIERARALGIDISLLKANLRLTPTERVRRGEAFLEFALQLREAGRLAREKQKQNDVEPIRDAADEAAE